MPTPSRPDPEQPPAPGPLARIADLREGEGVPLLLSVLLFGCLLGAWYCLRPTREVFGIDSGQVYNELWTWTAVVTIALTPLFGWLVSRFERRVFLPIVYLGGAALLVLFAFMHGRLEGEARERVGYAFYVFVSVLSVFATAVFWGFMADGWRDEQARRLFGLVAVGGTVGALLGGVVAAALLDLFESIEGLGPRDLIWFGAAGYVFAACLVPPLSRRFEARGGGSDAVPIVEATEPTGWEAALDGFRLFVRSPYLILIGVFLVGQTMASTFLYVESRAFTAEAFPTRGVAEAVAQSNRIARGEFFAHVDIAYNTVALFIQLFLVGRLVRWIGIGVMLATLPLVNLAGFAMLLGTPALWLYGLFEVAQRGSRFAVMKPAREMLFTVLSRDEKYKAKQFLDTAVYRSSDAGWAWIEYGLSSAAAPVGLTHGLLLLACGAWTGVAWVLGRRNTALRDGPTFTTGARHEL